MARGLMFIDAGAFIARHRTSDDYQLAATAGWQQIERRGMPCVTSNLVLAEAAAFLCKAAGGKFAAERMRLWLLADELTVLRPDKESELEAAGLMEKYADRQTGFTDCVSFVLMRRQEIRTVFGFDRHFRTAGFRLWPEHK